MILKPNEVKICMVALSTCIEDLEANIKDVRFPFTPSARKDMKDMLESAQSAMKKLSSITGHTVNMEPYKPGDETEFLTKQS